MTVVAFPKSNHPLSGLTLWHGTNARNVESVLREGIRPTTFPSPFTKKNPHACLTLDPACAFHYGRLSVALDLQATGPQDIALLAIPGECIDPDTLCIEYGSIEFAYGYSMPTRTRDVLEKIAKENNWHAFLQATSCLGVRTTIPTHLAQVDTRFYGIDAKTTTLDQALRDAETGTLGAPEHQAILAQPPRWLEARQQAA